MKRVIASVALTLAFSALPGLAGATQDLSLQNPPGAPNVGTALCLPGCPTPDPVGTVASAVQTSAAPALVPAVEPSPAVVPAVEPSPAVVPAVEPSPAVVPAVVADPAYGARLHAELCAPRPVFCEVDQSGKYITP